MALEKITEQRARHRLDAMLSPRSLAFVGASPKIRTPGNTMLRVASMDGFEGDVFAVNPKYGSIDGSLCYPSLNQLPSRVDHVVLALGNEQLEDGLNSAIRHGASAVTIFASCDGATREGRPLYERLTAMAREADVLVCGGNTMGFFHPRIGLRVSGYSTEPKLDAGGVALICQSGAAFGALAFHDRRLRFSLALSSGREMTTTAADYLDWALDQPETNVVGLFLESARDPGKFAECLAKADGLGIPVVILKVGRTELSARLAASHSGAVAGDGAAYEALFERWGVSRVATLDELAASLLLFSAGRPAQQGGLVALSDSGGEREMVADIAANIGVRFADIADHTRGALEPHLDDGLEPENPLDIWGSGRNFESNVEACMDALIADEDAAVGVLFQDIRDGSVVTEGFTRAIIRSSSKTNKPLALVTNFAGVQHVNTALSTTYAGVPVLDGTQEGLLAVKNLLAYRDHRSSVRSKPPAAPLAARQRWSARLSEGLPIGEAAGLEMLGDYGIRVPRLIEAYNSLTAVAAAESIGYPVVLKTAVPGILHKTEHGGVRLNLGDAEAVRRAYADLAMRLGPDVIVAEMVEPGVEFSFGLVRDAQFGPYVIASSGGMWIELLNDRSVAVPPFGPEIAERMIGSLKTRPLLAGYRGAVVANEAALIDALVKFSVLAAEQGEFLDAFDVNPVIVSTRGCVAVDALAILAPANARLG